MAMMSDTSTSAPSATPGLRQLNLPDMTAFEALTGHLFQVSWPFLLDHRLKRYRKLSHFVPIHLRAFLKQSSVEVNASGDL